jgi:hypothetical protein
MHIRLTRKKAFHRFGAVLAAVLVTAALLPATSASSASRGAQAGPVTQAAGPGRPALPGVPDNEAFRDNLRVTLYRSYLPSSGSQNQISAQLPKVSMRNTTTGVVTPLPTCGNFANPPRFDTDDSRYNIVASLYRFIRGPRIDQFPYCAWQLVVDTTHVNIFYPDVYAAYWATMWLAGPDQELIFDGVYPDNRYMTLTMYDGDSAFYTYNGRTSIIHDYEINPNPGSRNPWRTAGAAPGGSWRVVAKPNPGPNESNTLPSMANPPQPVTGNRLFAPTPPCGPTTSDPAPCMNEMSFSRIAEALQGSVWSNPDNAYVAADNVFSLRAGGEVQVIRGKKPVTVTGKHPVVWRANTKQYDMRYMSMCINPWVSPYPTESQDACVYDDQLVTDKNGYYTIVVSTRRSRPANATTANGVNWIQAEPRVNNLLIMRNMLTSSSFPNAPQNAPKNGNWLSTQKVMGEYYPVAGWSCTRQVYEASGVAGCYPSGPPPGQ